MSITPISPNSYFGFSNSTLPKEQIYPFIPPRERSNITMGEFKSALNAYDFQKASMMLKDETFKKKASAEGFFNSFIYDRLGDATRTLVMLKSFPQMKQEHQEEALGDIINFIEFFEKHELSSTYRTLALAAIYLYLGKEKGASSTLAWMMQQITEKELGAFLENEEQKLKPSYFFRPLVEFIKSHRQSYTFIDPSQKV